MPDNGSRTGLFQRALVSTRWLTIARFSGDAAGVVLFFALSRRLGIEATGDYSFAFAVAALVAAFVGLGMEEFGLREYSRLDATQGRATFRTIMGLQTLLGLAAGVALLGYLAFTGTTAERAWTVVLVVLHVLTFQYALMYFIPAYSRQHMQVPAILECICRAGPMIVAALLVTYAGSSLMMAIVPIAAGTTLLMLLALGSARREGADLRPNVRAADLKALLSTAWPIAASTLAYNLYGRAPVVLLALLAGAAETGSFATAYKLYEFGLMPVFLLGVAVFPGLSRSFEQPGRAFAGLANAFLRTSMVFGTLLAWGLLFLAPPLLPLVLGADFTAAVTPTRLIAAVAYLAAIDLAFLRITLAMHLQELRLRIQASAMVVVIGLCAALIPTHGAVGAIVAFASAQIVMIMLYLFVLSRQAQSRELLRTVVLGTALLATSLLAGALLWPPLVGPWAAAPLTLAGIGFVAIAGRFVSVQDLRRGLGK